jgi:DNA-binding NarL/FixJ family response regulator
MVVAGSVSPVRTWRPYVIRRILGAVAALAARDAERLLRFVAAAEELAGDDPFTPEVLAALWRAGDTRRRLRAALAALEWTADDGPRGVVLLTAGGRIDYASPAGRRLLRDYFGACGDEADVPVPVARWLETGEPRLLRRSADRRLTVTRSGASVLLEETRDELGLTSREQQILSWVARGKTNAEVAETLCIAPSTVRKHLDNIYAKLGVRTRTAAVAAFLGALDSR